jgi:hypothetical protein
MSRTRYALAILATASVLTASTSSADARWYRHRGPGPVLGLVGGVLVGAATIATLPLVVVGDALGAGAGYDGPQGYGYGPPPQPVSAYGYNYGDGGNYGPPPPPRGYYGRPYGPPPGYYDDGY